MFEARWNRLVHYVRKGLAGAGHDETLLEANDERRLLRIPIPGTGLWWGFVVEEEDILYGDLTQEAAFLLTAFRIACARTGAVTAPDATAHGRGAMSGRERLSGGR